MRCFFMRSGRITAVEMLNETSDAARIAKSRELFKLKGPELAADGFEVWDGARFVYRHPEDEIKTP